MHQFRHLGSDGLGVEDHEVGGESFADEARSVKPQCNAGSKVTMRTACSRVNACVTRTQWLSTCVWSDESMS